MTPETWTRVREVFDAAVTRPAADRAAFLDDTCAGQPDVRAEVTSLLAAHERAAGFIESPAYHAAADLLVDDDDASSDRKTLRAGQALGPYLIRHEIGRGGMGIVYLADDTRLARRVALKAITPETGSDSERRARMRQEARAAAALSHPGIATIYALEEIDGELYLACEYVPGPTLRLLIEQGPLRLRDTVDVAIQLGRALAAAHAQGIVHRDLKPENIVRSPAGIFKVLDFGIARIESFSGTRLSIPGTLVGTPAYMSPEQIRHEEVDYRADIFALGLVVYEMASGRNPFEADRATATMARILEVEPQALTQLSSEPSAALDRIVATCMRKRRDDRYSSTQALVDDLERLQDQLSSRRTTSAVPRVAEPSASAPSSPRAPRFWWAFHQVAASAVCLLMIYPAWSARPWLPRPADLVFFFTIVATAAASITVRLHLLFTTRFYPDEMPAQRVHALPWARWSDLAFAAMLLAAAFGIGGAHLEVATLFVAVSIAVLVAVLLIEPATTRAVFERSGDRVS